MRRIFLLLMLFLYPASALALGEVEGERGYLIARGAVDIMGVYSHNRLPDSLTKEHTNGQGRTTFRLMLEAGMGEHLRLDVNAYQSLIVDSAEAGFFQAGLPRAYRTTYLDYDWGEANITAPVGFDRLSLMIYAGDVDITIGRQPIGLATNFIFTPNDIFHPFAAGAADTAFRPGVDAVRLDWRLGMLSKLTLLGAAGYDEENHPSFERSAALLRASTNQVGFDWSILGGKADGRYLTGVGISGELWKLGWRLEGNVSFPYENEENPFVQLAFGMDKRWENTTHLMLEYYYHQNGSIDPEDYLAMLDDRRMNHDTYLGEHYVGLMLSGEPLPIVTLQAAILANLTDPSAYFAPSVVYSAADEVELIATGAIPLGYAPDEKTHFSPFVREGKTSLPTLHSEFGSYPFSFSMQARIYF